MYEFVEHYKKFFLALFFYSSLTCGMMIGPSPVHVQLKPVAILRFFLKYVFKANALADDEVPIPIPE